MRDPRDPCQFFRIQASNASLAHYSQDMLWSCDEIARRRAAGLPLGDRLEATAAMLDTYRDAIITAGTEAFTRKSRSGQAPWELVLSEEEKTAIADSTDALLVIEAIRGGF